MRKTIITCDKCDKEIYGQHYYTLAVREVRNGNQIKLPTIWLCRDCFLKAGINIITPAEKN